MEKKANGIPAVNKEDIKPIKDEKKEKPIKFKITGKSDVFKAFTDILFAMDEDAKFNITDKGISITIADAAHVLLVDVFIKNTAFGEYNVDEIGLGVDLKRLSGTLKLAGPDDNASLEYDSHENRLVITVGNVVRRIGIIDTEGIPELKMPKLDLPAKLVMLSGEFSKGIRATMMVSDHLAMTVYKERFEMSAESGADVISLKLPKGKLIELNTSEKCRSMFSIDYLSDIVKLIKSEDPVTLIIGNDHPVKVEFDIADRKGHVAYMLAPRIEAE